RIDDKRECRRGLAAARVVQVIAWANRAPIRENAHEPAVPDVRFHDVFRKVRKSKAFQRAIPNQSDGVAYEPSLDADSDFAVVFSEFPDVEAARGRQAVRYCGADAPRPASRRRCGSCVSAAERRAALPAYGWCSSAPTGKRQAWRPPW